MSYRRISELAQLGSEGISNRSVFEVGLELIFIHKQ